MKIINFYITKSGTKQWRKNDKLHREDGPAVELSTGTKEWYLNGKHHREDGPAVELSTGTKQWWKNDKLHREDGPAIELSTGTKAWYLEGKCIGENDKGFWEFLDSISEDKKKNPKLLEYYPESAIRKFSFSQNF